MRIHEWKTTTTRGHMLTPEEYNYLKKKQNKNNNEAEAMLSKI